MYASGGTSYTDPKLAWRYWGESYPGVSLDGWNDNDGACKRRWTVVHVDMDMDGVADNGPATQETTPGGFIALNDDDDDHDGILDNVDNNNSQENDLVKITLKKVQPEGLGGTVTLSAVGGAKIKVWSSSTKGTEIPLPKTYSTPGELPKDLWVEGYQASGGPRDVTLVLTHSVTGFQDKIKLTVMEVDLDISGVSDADEEAKGALVVRRYDNNNAPRKEIILRRVIPNAWDGNVVLSRSLTKIKVYDAETGGTEITFNGADNKFANSALPKSLWVQGDTATNSMRGVELDLVTEPLPVFADTVTFTVLWVDVTTDHSGSVNADNGARDAYANMVVPPGYSLGYHLFCQGSLAATWNGRGSEFIGTVSPSDLVVSDFEPGQDPDNILYLWREIISGNQFWGPSGYEESLQVNPGSDISAEIFRDGDPQSGGSNGRIYDVDVPGLSAFYRVTENPGVIGRYRVNFVEWVEWNQIRCSLKKEWFTRQSYKRTGSVDSGTASGGSSNTLTDSSKSWTASAWVPGVVGVANDPARRITGNTANTLTVTPDWSSVGPGSQYLVMNTSTWTQINDVAGDNTSGDGSTPITWNLQ